MWRYGLLSAPIWGLALFYLFSFEWALSVYLVCVCLSFGLYAWLTDQQFRLHESAPRHVLGGSHENQEKRSAVSFISKMSGISRWQC